jgi:hypothetical protein
MYLPGYKNLAEFAAAHGFHYMTAYNQMKQGYCKWPRKFSSGISKDPAYSCWENMVQRCTNIKAESWKDYGGRGITVYPPWIRDFRKFAKCIGPRPNKDYSIDRIDNSRGYEPGNVRWATYKEQSANKRCHKVNGDGIDKHGRYYRFVYQGQVQKYLTREEAAEAKDNIYGKGNW